MNNKEFTRLVENRCEVIKSVLIKKGEEYSSDVNRLHNFIEASKLMRCTPENALLGFMTKHIVSIIDIIKDTENGKFPTEELVSEKITDNLNYLILLEALLTERRNTSNKECLADILITKTYQ